MRLLRSLLSKKTDDEIAVMMDKPVESVAAAIRKMTGKITRPKVKAVKKRVVKKKSEAIRRVQLDNARLERSRRRRESERMKSRTLDLTGKVPVRLDRKTIVYVAPGTDIEALKSKLLKR